MGVGSAGVGSAGVGSVGVRSTGVGSTGVGSVGVGSTGVGSVGVGVGSTGVGSVGVGVGSITSEPEPIEVFLWTFFYNWYIHARSLDYPMPNILQQHGIESCLDTHPRQHLYLM